VTPFFHEAYFAACFFFFGPMNALTIYILWKEKRIERELQAEIRKA
jgi:hypothetical protein